MKRALRLAIPVMMMALAVTMLSVTPALAAKGGVKGKPSTSGAITSSIISLNESSPRFGGTVSFTVNADPSTNIYILWAANKCSQGGVIVYAEYQPVQNGQAGPFTLSWADGGAADCEAYVWLFPDPATPITDGLMTYSAAAN